MTVTIETSLTWNGDKALDLIDDATGRGAKQAAENVKRVAGRKFRSQWSRKTTGELIKHLKVKQSKFNDKNYIVGIFASNTKPWEDSIGARAIFFEFGRSAKSKGRMQGQKSQAPGDRAQRPRPFLRPALKTARKSFNSLLGSEIKKALR